MEVKILAYPSSWHRTQTERTSQAFMKDPPLIKDLSKAKQIETI